MTELKRELGSFSCTMLVAGNMIGIGIFITAGRIASVLPHPQLILIAWVLGGLLSLAGALSYAELGTRFPRAGGTYIYLKEAFGPLCGFLSGFSCSVVTIPGASAFLAIGFTRYAGITDPTVAKCVAIALIVLFSLVNYWGVKWGAGLQNSFMVLKLFLIFLLIFFGFMSGQGSWDHFFMAGAPTHSFLLALPLAMIPILYTYSGWDASIYVAGEIKNPSRTIPFSLFSGTLIVTLIYLGLAALYIYAIPVTTADHQTKIVTAASSIFFGEKIGKVVGSLVALSILGCLSAAILTGPRVVYAMAKDGLLPSRMAHVHEFFASPSHAILFQGMIASLLAVTGTFDQLLDFATVPAIFFQTLTVVGLFFIRWRNQSDPQTQVYLTLGYPLIPALFVSAQAWIIISTILKSPKDSIWGLVMVSLGLPIYFFWKRFKAYQ